MKQLWPGAKELWTFPWRPLPTQLTRGERGCPLSSSTLFSGKEQSLLKQRSSSPSELGTLASQTAKEQEFRVRSSEKKSRGMDGSIDSSLLLRRCPRLGTKPFASW